MVYDRVAERYDRLMAPLERRFLRRWREETLGLLPKNANILEVGAGTGANFAIYPPATCAVATEFVAEMIARAASRSERPILAQANVESLPFPDSHFDAAFATLVFCSVANPEAGFAELNRVVRPGGTIVLLEHVRPSGLLGYVFDAFNIFSTALFEDCFNRRTAELADRSGLIIIEVRRKAFGAVNLIVCERP